jgi:cell division protein FtsN
VARKPAPHAEADTASLGTDAASDEEFTMPNPPPPANHDPRESVARFVGDKGPLQLSSRALPESTWAADPSEGSVAESPGPTEAPPTPKGRKDRPRHRSSSRHGSGRRVATAALLAAIVVATAIVLVMRAGSLARSRAGQVGAAVTATTAPQGADKASSTAPQDADKASSPDVSRSGRTARATSPVPVGERRPGGSTTRSRGPYTLEVGGYSDFENALYQRDRMQELTGFEGWVVPSADGSSYRVVLGAYRSHERATGAANMLLNSRTLSNVTVVPLPPRSQRR